MTILLKMEILRLFVLKLRKEKSRISKFFEFKSRGVEWNRKNFLTHVTILKNSERKAKRNESS